MQRIRVLVVDDSVVMRRLISTVLESDPRIEVTGVAANGKIALTKIERDRPDLITLDIEMPEMDGLETLNELRQRHPKIPVIMFSTLTQRGAVKTIDALARGAVDYVAKPANVGSVDESLARLRNDLLPKILAFGKAGPVSTPRVEAPVRKDPPRTRPAGNQSFSVVAIAASTGGPNALETVLTTLPSDFRVPVVIVQHMPPVFTGLLAKRLNEVSKITVVEAEEGQVFQPGHAYLAPGGKHLEACAKVHGIVAHLQEGLPENSCRPAADVLFRTVAKIWGGNSLCVVMTGMGQDGMRGARGIREKGGTVYAQDRESSVVWGMPGSVVDAGLADAVYPLKDLGPAIAIAIMKDQFSALVR